jgi:hypothetical protein
MWRCHWVSSYTISRGIYDEIDVSQGKDKLLFFFSWKILNIFHTGMNHPFLFSGVLPPVVFYQSIEQTLEQERESFLF